MKLAAPGQIRPDKSGAMRTTSYWLSGALLALTTTLILEGAAGLNLLLGWLITINFFTFLYYAIDKLNAVFLANYPQESTRKVRIPEHSLLLLSLAGGSPGGLLALIICNHKTNDAWFVFRLLAILIAQAALVVWLWDEITALL